MLQLLLFGCIVFPFLLALAAAMSKNEGTRRTVVLTGVGGTALSALGLALNGGFWLPVPPESWLNGFMTLLDFALLGFILYLAISLKHRLSILLALGQTAGLLYLDFGLVSGHVSSAFYADPLALAMVLVVSFVGGVICIYGLGYMKEHEEHLRLITTRQPRFFFFMLLFLGAMNGLVLTDSLPWLFFFWEVTTLCSFMLISHDGTREAKNNAIRALWMNLAGGLAFVAAMLFLYKSIGLLSIQAVLRINAVAGLEMAFLSLPLAFFCLAGFTKSAQVPFQSWLCGAMVAPTPVSALLHSSTMVKAGVYLVLRLSPAFAGTTLASLVALVGAFTFVTTSALAVGQSNGKKILAYSTIANLGLIIACAGIGTPEAITAAILLIIFHAVSKGLLFLCVGAIEQHIGSRDIEAMRGLCQIMPATALITVIGICSMMLPPFGALLAKWMALEAAATSITLMPVLVLFIAMGSALTVLFWARWAGMLLGLNPVGHRPVQEQQDSTVSLSLRILAGGVVALSLLVPFIYLGLRDSIRELFGVGALYDVNMGVFANGIGMFAVYPLFILLGLGVVYALRAMRKAEGRVTALPYLSGIQQIENGKVGFNGPLGEFTEVTNANYYLHHWFGEERLTGTINTIALVLMVIMVGGLL